MTPTTREIARKLADILEQVDGFFDQAINSKYDTVRKVAREFEAAIEELLVPRMATAVLDLRNANAVIDSDGAIWQLMSNGKFSFVAAEGTHTLKEIEERWGPLTPATDAPAPPEPKEQMQAAPKQPAPTTVLLDKFGKRWEQLSDGTYAIQSNWSFEALKHAYGPLTPVLAWSANQPESPVRLPPKGGLTVTSPEPKPRSLLDHPIMRKMPAVSALIEDQHGSKFGELIRACFVEVAWQLVELDKRIEAR